MKTDSVDSEDDPLRGGNEREEIFVEQKSHLYSGREFRDPALRHQLPDNMKSNCLSYGCDSLYRMLNAKMEEEKKRAVFSVTGGTTFFYITYLN